MTQWNSLNVKLKSSIKNKTEVVLRLSSMVGDYETDFPHKLLLTNRQVSNLLQIIHQLILSYQKLNYLR